jgi:peptidoglycan/LPS O-acetylase OafA/YrhL
MGYLPYIDGLRGVAVLVILLFHLDIGIVSGGFAGVDIFFVISGYLITRIIADEIRAGRFSFANFYARRIKRIFPALFFMLIGASALAVLTLGVDEFSDFFRAFRYASAQISNLYFNREVDYFQPEQAISPLLHTWSLGVEEQFYAMWPLLLFGIYKFGGEKKWPLILGAVFAVSLIASEWLVQADPLQAFYMLHSRAWQLALGGLVALQVFPKTERKSVNEILAMLGVVLMAAPLFLYDHENFPGLKAFVPCLGVALLFYTYQNQPALIHKVLAFKPLVAVGLISYSLYLWHWPFIAIYKLYMNVERLDPPAQIGIATLSFVMAVVSYFAIERPLRRIKASPLIVIGFGLVCIAVFIVGSNGVKKWKEANWRVTYNVDPVERVAHPLDGVCSKASGVHDKENCIVGPHKDAYEVIVAGDSNASHHVPMVLAWAKERGLTVRLFTRSACPTWLYTDGIPERDGRPDTNCTELVEEFHKIIKTDKSIRYIFLAKSLPEDTAFARASIDDIKATGIPIYFMGAIPWYEEDPHKCKVRQNVILSKWVPRESKDCMALDSAYYTVELAPVIGFRAMLKEKSVPYFDPMPDLVDGYDNDGHFLFHDRFHLNLYGSEHLIPSFEKFMKVNDRAER